MATFKQLIKPNLDPYLVQPKAGGGTVTLMDWLGYCLAYAEQCFGLFYLAPSAWKAWLGSKRKHTDRVFPKGVYFFIWFSHYGTYGGVYANWGHVAIAYVHPVTGALQIWSSPISRKPFADTWGSIAEVETKYNAKYVGWSEDMVGHNVIEQIADPVNVPIQPNQRVVASADGVNGRSAPNTTASIVKEFAKGDTLDFKGYVKGQAVSGNNIWFVGAYSDTYWWSGAFANTSTDGLQPLDTVIPPPVVVPTPPVVEPLPTLSPVFEKQLACVTSVEQVNTTNYQTDSFPTAPTAVVLHDFGTDGKDTLGSSLNQFKAPNTSAPHFVVSGKQIIQTGKLDWRMYHAGPLGNDKIGIEIDPDVDTNVDTQASVEKLLRELDTLYGKLTRHKHSEFMATACGDDVVMALFSLATMYPPVIEPSEPVVPPVIIEPEDGGKKFSALLALFKPIFDFLQKMLNIIKR